MKIIYKLFSCLVVLFSTATQAEITLIFGIYTSDKPTAMVSIFRPILNELEEKLSQRLKQTVSIKMQVAKDYDQGISDLVNAKVDFARMGPASYILSKQQNPELKLLVMESKKGNKTFNGVICVHQDSTVQQISELKNNSFAFGNKNSTIGRYLSQLLLAEHGIHADQLSKFEYLERHDRVGTAVGLGEFDAGALKESTYEKLKAKNVPIKELARFPNVTKPWIASDNLAEEIMLALRESLLEIDSPEVLKRITKDGFLSADDSDYDLIRESIDKNELFFKPSMGN
jgi:phosphonate transport system substrate-binding protein